MEKRDQTIQDFCRELATALQRIAAGETTSGISPSQITPVTINDGGTDE